MASFNTLLTSILLSLAYASYTVAAPRSSQTAHATHGVVKVGRRGLEIETFSPPSTYETFGAGIPQALNRRQDANLEESTVAFVQEKLGVDASAVEYTKGFEASEAEYAYVKQKHDNVPFANSVANVAFKNGKVVAFGSSFTKSKKIASSTPSITEAAAIASAESTLEGAYNKHPVSVEYLTRSDGSVALTYVVQVQNEETASWLEAFVDAHTAKVISVTDFTAEASYHVLPISKQDLREGFEVLTDPADLSASPLGWHNDGTTSTTVTSGNNIIAYKTSLTATTSQTSSELNFLYNHTITEAPAFPENLDFARTNAFYIGNAYHDILYKYGFTESAFNFQNANFEKGGSGNDAVRIHVQAPGFNNANFATPPDGQAGLMNMFIWNKNTPNRDGSLSNDIIIHEYTHGLSNRLTGGGTGRCLTSTEARGMGEGWSDAMAEWTEHKTDTLSDWLLTEYVNGGVGLRHYPYSTDAAVNPLRYSSIPTLSGLVHYIGEVWANTLHNVYAALLAEHGFSEYAHTDPTGTGANVVFGHLLIDALALQPCGPTFITARAAWIQADANRYGGANRCLLWKAFASRGLGINATSSYVDGAAIPDDC